MEKLLGSAVPSGHVDVEADLFKSKKGYAERQYYLFDRNLKVASSAKFPVTSAQVKVHASLSQPFVQALSVSRTPAEELQVKEPIKRDTKRMFDHAQQAIGATCRRMIADPPGARVR